MGIWDDLDKEMAVDNRLGNHDFVVDSVVPGNWPSGDPYIEIAGRLTTADNFDIKKRFTPALTDEQLAERLPNLDRAAKQSALLAHRNDETLKAEYGVTLAQIKQGDTFRVKTDKRTDKNDKTKYYVEIIAFLPKTAALSGNGTASNVPF